MTDLSTPVRRFRSMDWRWFCALLGLQVLLLAVALLLSPLLLLLVAAAAIGGAFAVLTILRPWLIVPLVVVTTGLDSAARLAGGTDPSFHPTAFHLTFVLTLVAIVGNACLRRRVTFPEFELARPLLLFLFAMAVSLIYSPNQPTATIGFVRMSCLVLFVYMTQVIVDSKRAVATVLWCMSVLTVAGAIMGAYQVITGRFHLPVKVIQALGGNVPRATATFQNPNIFATFLLSGFLPILAVLLNVRTRLTTRVLYGVAVMVGAGGLLATFSRSSWLAAVVGVLVILWLSGKVRYFFIVGAAGVVVVIALKEFVPFAEYIFERFTSIFTVVERFGMTDTASGSARVFLIRAAFNMFLDHPLLGVGWRGFPIVFHHYAPSGYPFWTRVDESHTVLATVLAELGLVGFIAFCWFIGRTLRRGLSAARRMQDPYLRAVLIGLVATFTAHQVSQSFNGTYSDNMFWFYTGMLFAVVQLGERQERA